MRHAPSLGCAIRERRIALGMTQEELAERIGDGVRQSDVSRLERGKVALPRRSRLEAIAAALGLSNGDLLARSGWVGSEEAFAEVSAPAGDRDAIDPISPPWSPPASSVHPSRPGTPGMSRLLTAIERARSLEERAIEILHDAEQAYDRAVKPRRTKDDRTD